MAVPSHDERDFAFRNQLRPADHSLSLIHRRGLAKSIAVGVDCAKGSRRRASGRAWRSTKAGDCRFYIHATWATRQVDDYIKIRPRHILCLGFLEQSSGRAMDLYLCRLGMALRSYRSIRLRPQQVILAHCQQIEPNVRGQAHGDGDAWWSGRVLSRCAVPTRVWRDDQLGLPSPVRP